MADVTTKGLIEELVKEDEQMLAAEEAYQQARMRMQLAMRRYAAIRDYVTERLRDSPYREPGKYGINAFPSGGRFRFAQLAVGDAIVAAFKEREPGGTMTFEEIMAALTSGGKLAAPRAVNAALMRTTGVEAVKGGKYRYVESDTFELEDD